MHCLACACAAPARACREPAHGAARTRCTAVVGPLAARSCCCVPCRAVELLPMAFTPARAWPSGSTQVASAHMFHTSARRCAPPVTSRDAKQLPLAAASGGGGGGVSVRGNRARTTSTLYMTACRGTCRPLQRGSKGAWACQRGTTGAHNARPCIWAYDA